MLAKEGVYLHGKDGLCLEWGLVQRQGPLKGQPHHAVAHGSGVGGGVVAGFLQRPSIEPIGLAFSDFRFDEGKCGVAFIGADVEPSPSKASFCPSVPISVSFAI